MKVEMSRGVTSEGVVYAYIKIGGNKIENSFCASKDYEDLTGLPYLYVESTSSCVAPNSGTKVMLGGRVTIFPWNRIINLHQMPLVDLKKELQLRRTDILNWHRNLKGKEEVVIELI